MTPAVEVMRGIGTKTIEPPSQVTVRVRFEISESWCWEDNASPSSKKKIETRKRRSVPALCTSV